MFLRLTALYVIVISYLPFRIIVNGEVVKIMASVYSLSNIMHALVMYHGRGAFVKQRLVSFFNVLFLPKIWIVFHSPSAVQICGSKRNNYICEKSHKLLDWKMGSVYCLITPIWSLRCHVTTLSSRAQILPFNCSCLEVKGYETENASHTNSKRNYTVALHPRWLVLTGGLSFSNLRQLNRLLMILFLIVRINKIFLVYEALIW